MSWNIYIQPNGLLMIYNTVSDHISYYDLLAPQVIELYGKNYGVGGVTHAQKTMSELNNLSQDEVIQRWEEMVAFVTEVHGEFLIEINKNIRLNNKHFYNKVVAMRILESSVELIPQVDIPTSLKGMETDLQRMEFLNNLLLEGKLSNHRFLIDNDQVTLYVNDVVVYKFCVDPSSLLSDCLTLLGYSPEHV